MPGGHGFFKAWIWDSGSSIFRELESFQIRQMSADLHYLGVLSITVDIKKSDTTLKNLLIKNSLIRITDRETDDGKVGNVSTTLDSTTNSGTTSWQVGDEQNKFRVGEILKITHTNGVDFQYIKISLIQDGFLHSTVAANRNYPVNSTVLREYFFYQDFEIREPDIPKDRGSPYTITLNGFQDGYGLHDTLLVGSYESPNQAASTTFQKFCDDAGVTVGNKDTTGDAGTSIKYRYRDDPFVPKIKDLARSVNCIARFRRTRDTVSRVVDFLNKTSSIATRPEEQIIIGFQTTNPGDAPEDSTRILTLWKDAFNFRQQDEVEAEASDVIVLGKGTGPGQTRARNSASGRDVSYHDPAIFDDTSALTIAGKVKSLTPNPRASVIKTIPQLWIGDFRAMLGDTVTIRDGTRLTGVSTNAILAGVSQSVAVANWDSYAVGDKFTITHTNGTTREEKTITLVQDGSIHISSTWANNYPVGSTVTSVAGDALEADFNGVFIRWEYSDSSPGFIIHINRFRPDFNEDLLRTKRNLEQMMKYNHGAQNWASNPIGANASAARPLFVPFYIPARVEKNHKCTIAISAAKTPSRDLANPGSTPVTGTSGTGTANVTEIVTNPTISTVVANGQTDTLTVNSGVLYEALLQGSLPTGSSASLGYVFRVSIRPVNSDGSDYGASTEHTDPRTNVSYAVTNDDNTIVYTLLREYISRWLSRSGGYYHFAGDNEEMRTLVFLTSLPAGSWHLKVGIYNFESSVRYYKCGYTIYRYGDHTHLPSDSGHSGHQPGGYTTDPNLAVSLSGGSATTVDVDLYLDVQDASHKINSSPITIPSSGIDQVVNIGTALNELSETATGLHHIIVVPNATIFLAAQTAVESTIKIS